MYYNARWYDPQLGRFTQVDTIIPGAGNLSAWDRYAYTLNNPLRYTDPSGHMVDDGDDGGVGITFDSPSLSNDDSKSNDDSNCADASYSIVSACFDLTESEMDEFYEDLGTVSTVNDVFGAASLIAALLGLSGSSLAMQLVVGLVIVGVAGPTAIALVAALPAVFLLASAALLISGAEMGGVRSNIVHTDANSLGGTVTVANYGIVTRYTVTTNKDSLDSWGITNITPLIIAHSWVTSHPTEPIIFQ